MKTNAMRVLEALGIQYTIHEYEWDEEHLDAVNAAESAGLNPEKVYKTIVLKNSENRLFVFCLPAEFEISMKKVRTLTESKDVDLLKTSELQKYTGYVRGGCSPLGMIKKYPTYIEEMARIEDTICVSGGQRGLQLEVRPEELALACGGSFADFT